MQQKCTIEEFKKALESSGKQHDVAFIDVCSAQEHNEHHVKGVQNIPLDELLLRLNELKEKKTIYVHCLSGGRSQLAAELLESHGINAQIYNVEGGLIAWHRAGFPIHQN